MNPISLTFQIAPVAYLFAATTAQLYSLNYCFGSTIEPFSLAVISASLTLFSAAYLIGFNRRQVTYREPFRPDALSLIAWALLAASAVYILIATGRVVARWDAFSHGPTVARVILLETRVGVTGLGFLNSVLLGAPAVLAIFVATYGERLKHDRLFKAAAVIAFGAFTYLMSLEGGRFPFLVSIGFLLAAIGFRLLRGHSLRTIGPVFLVGLAAVSAGALSFSYKEIGNRETMRGRGTPAQVQSNYSAYVSDFIAQPAAEPDKPAMGTKTVVSCFYFSHPPKSIDRIVSKGADENLFGFYMMPNYYKLAQLLGIAKKDWLHYSDHYEITGMYSGLLGALLIDFSWFGLLLMAAVGYVCGRLVSQAIDKQIDRSPNAILVAIVPVFVLIIPVADLTSTAQFQSMLPWLALTFFSLWLASWREQARPSHESIPT